MTWCDVVWLRTSDLLNEEKIINVILKLIREDYSDKKTKLFLKYPLDKFLEAYSFSDYHR